MSKSKQEAYIVSAVRTPVGKARGVFRYTRPDDLLSYALAAVMKNVPEIALDKIDDVIVGCAMPEAEQGMNVARISLILAGYPEKIPGMTINRFCSSGLQSIAIAAERIGSGDGDIFVAAGTESMTMVPMGGNKFVANPRYYENAEFETMAYGMGLTAEFVAEKWQITRQEQDAFALESHNRALAANKRGDFRDEIIPVNVQLDLPDLKTGKILRKIMEISQDEGPRAGSTMEALAKLPTVFKVNGTVTAANSSQMSDGAAALLVVSEKVLKQYKLKPLAKYKGFKVAGVSPKYMGIGPKEAIPLALAEAGLGLADIDWIELNEAFAAQTLAVMKECKLSPEKTNPLGGAIAWGHPLGATGAIRAATLIHGLRRQKKKYGMVTMCIGTGMGAAGIFEAM